MNNTECTVEFGSTFGDIYARWTLDCIIEYAYAVSNDFIAKPHLYQREDIPDVIVDLRMAYGMSRNFPNMSQRQFMLTPIFGISDSRRSDVTVTNSSFHVARKKLVDACIAFSERAVDSGLAMLRDRVKSALVPLRSHFQSVAGKSVQASYNQHKAIFDVAIEILKTKGIVKVFGVDAPGEGWPLNSDDSNGAKLVSAISSTLTVEPEYVFTYEKFIFLQRVAREGQDALQAILSSEFSSEENLENLVTKVYTWGTSLRDFREAN
jgi:hypothetical protein